MIRHCFFHQLAFLLIVLAGAQDSPQVQLKNGKNRCTGRVEILYNGTWGTICDDKGNGASVICQQLGCGLVRFYTFGYAFGFGSGPIWLGGLNCTGNESHVWKCPSWGWGPHNCSHEKDAGVLCTGFLRLAGQDGPCSGRVEVNSGGRWTPVSDVNFTLSTAHVVCAELGCGKAVSVLGNVTRSVSEQVWDEEFQCVGQEPELWFCPRVPCAGGSCQYGGAVEVVCSDRPQLRLINGGSRCAGRVEIFHQDSWGTICHRYWDITDANVVCKDLGCGAAVEAVSSANYGAGSGPIWLESLRCTGEESHVWQCPSLGWNNTYCTHEADAGVICTGFVHLSGGEGPCSGRVEVNLAGDWIPVSDRNFTFATAQVICAELECGKAVSVMRAVPFREVIPQVWSEEFWCEGQELGLWFCPRVPCPGGSCQHSGAVEVVCSEFTEVRLMKNSTSQCEGQVEMNTSVGWRALCASHWSMANADVVCRQLGCGIAISTPEGGMYFVEGDHEIWNDRFYCSGVESFLWSCPVIALGVPPCAQGNTASVVCSGNRTQLLSQGKEYLSEAERSASSEDLTSNSPDRRYLRLVDGRSPCAGRVEILHQGSWGTICDDSWDLNDAHVVCRQLGCGVALNATVSAHFGQGSGDIWLDELNCTGQESHVWKCPSQGWGEHNCWHKEDAGVICSAFLALRVVSEEQECAGWLEVFYNGTWGNVCHNPMEDMTLSVICRQLGCGDSGTLNTSVPAQQGSRPHWVDGIQCQKTDISLWQCPSDPWNSRSCLPKDEAYITCAGQRLRSCPESTPCTDRDKLRLSGGDSKCSGRVEVWHKDSWGTVCDDSWGLAEAEVVCQQLGCGRALDALGAAAFGPGNGTIWMDEVKCSGWEPSLWACGMAPWGQSDCKHEEDAGVRCSGECTTSVSPSVPGNFSLYEILCIILGTLLLLSLIISATQMGIWKATHQALSTEDAVDEALYQEIEYLVKAEKMDFLDKAGTVPDNSEAKLLYYTEDNEDDVGRESTSEHPWQHGDATGNGYDDVGEVLVLEIPSSYGRSEKNFVPEEKDDARYFQTDGQLSSVLQETTLSFMEEKESPVVLRQEETAYDDIELDATL
ncbi:antigen WC1.1-like [Octodon degus]|uniref:Antigen WC1.1-like n=1 Tax=Octodon degus TaxID=10160 RepID=A0A6P3VE48_OCTDE|nr:antigen WC1.1-like [Octodon degus]